MLYYTPGMRQSYSANRSLAREISERLEPELNEELTPKGRRSITPSASAVGLLCVTPSHNSNDFSAFVRPSSLGWAGNPLSYRVLWFLWRLSEFFAADSWALHPVEDGGKPQH